MPHSFYQKRSRARSLVATVLVVLMLCFGTVGNAAPRSLAQAEESTATPAPAPTNVSIPENSAPAAGLPAADQPVAAPQEPGVSIQPVTQEPVAKSTAITRGTTTKPTWMKKSTLGLAAAAAGAGALATTPPYASFQDVDWQAWRLSPASQVGWAKSNLGNYQEGDWIPVRIVVDNTSGSDAVRLPSFKLAFDYVTSGAVGVDGAKGFNYAVTTNGTVPSAQAVPAGAQDISGLVTKSVSGGFYNVDVATPSPDLVIPKGQYGMVYLKVHLAITYYWNQQNPSHNGAASYPGSSAQGRFTEWNGGGTGQKTISVPVGPGVMPNGQINGLKFRDDDGSATQNPGEPGLAGWDFTLHYNDPDFPFAITATSGSNPLGAFTFVSLPEGNYTMNETPQSGWQNTTPLPMSIDVVHDGSQDVKIGNQQKHLSKVFQLSLDSAVSGATSYFVRYSVDGGASQTAALTFDAGSGTYRSSAVSIIEGATVDSWQFFANISSTLGGGTVALSDVLGPETIDTSADAADGSTDGTVHNCFTYVPGSISGHKFIDGNRNGLLDITDALANGWTMQLFRDGELYDTVSTTTHQGNLGVYEFDGLLPGDYTVQEVQDANYSKVLPATLAIGPLAIASGAALTDNNFLNQPKAEGITITKTAQSSAHVGDSVTYSFTVANSADTAITLTSLDDSVFGDLTSLVSPQPFAGTQLAPVGQPGSSRTYTYTATITKAMIDEFGDPLTNRATVVGAGPFGTVTAEDSHTLDVLHPAIDVTKVASTATVTDSGDVTYTYNLTNTGDATLTVTGYNDVPHGQVADVPFVLAPHATTQATLTRTISEPTTNTVTVTAHDALDEEVTDCAQAHVGVNITKTFDLDLTSSVTGVDGYVVTWNSTAGDGEASLAGAGLTHDAILPYGTEITSWDVFANVGGTRIDLTGAGSLGGETLTGPTTNRLTFEPGDITGEKILQTALGDTQGVGWTIDYDGPADTSGTAVTDANGEYAFAGLLPGNYDLDEQQQANYTQISHPDQVTLGVDVSQGEGGYTATVSSASGVDFVNAPNPSAIKIIKSGPAEAHVGDSVTYTFTISNEGVTDLRNLTLVDSVFGDITNKVSLSLVGMTIEAGSGPVVVTYTHTVAASDDDPLVNTAVVSAMNPFDETLTACDSHTLDVLHPAIDVTKDASTATVTDSGDVTYTYNLTNTGDATLTVTGYNDVPHGQVADVPFVLAPHATTQATLTRTISEPTTNTVTVTAHDALDEEVTDCAQAHVSVNITKTFALNVIEQAPAATGYQVDYVVDGVSHTEDLANETGTIWRWTTTFPYGTDIGTYQFFAVTASGRIAVTGLLAGETLVRGPVTNWGTFSPGSVSGTKRIDTDRDGDADTTGSGWTIELYRGEQFVASTVTASDGTYSFDDLLPGTYSLHEQQQANYTQLSAPDTFSIPAEGPVTGMDFVNQPVPSAISLTKSVVPGDPAVPARYTFTIANEGPWALDPVVLTDPMLSDQLAGVTIPALAPNGQEGDSYTFSVDWPVPVEAVGTTINNTATVSGTDTFGMTVSDTDSATFDVPFAPFTELPDLTIKKNADRDSVHPGDVVRYTLSYENVGFGDAIGYTIEDDFDERYVTVVDAGGGTVTDGKIRWEFTDTLSESDGVKTVTYTVRVDPELASDVTRVDNVAVISTQDEGNPENNRASLSLPVRRTSAPFLPFTGGGLAWLLLAAAFSAAIGVVLRRNSRTA